MRVKHAHTIPSWTCEYVVLIMSTQGFVDEVCIRKGRGENLQGKLTNTTDALSLQIYKRYM